MRVDNDDDDGCVCRWMDLFGSLLDVFCGFACWKGGYKKTHEKRALSPLSVGAHNTFFQGPGLLRHKNKRVVRREKRHTKNKLNLKF